MSFILSPDRRSGPATVQAFAAYRAYLASVRDQLPAGVAAIALTDWYYNPTDHRCPHDAWLESMSVLETGQGARREQRSVSITVRLLSAYHDGYIEFRYRDVTHYRIQMEDATPHPGGHNDWRYDEFRLTSTGGVEHEIEWRGRTSPAHWIIEAGDVEYRWLPSADGQGP